MDKNRYSRFTAVVFSIIALLHAIRLFSGWEVVIAGVSIPLWVSAVAVLVAGCLAYYGYKLAK